MMRPFERGHLPGRNILHWLMFLALFGVPSVFGATVGQQELMALFRQELNAIPDVEARVQDLSLSGFSAQRGFPIELTVRGPDWDELARVSEELEERMAASPLMVSIWEYIWAVTSRRKMLAVM